MTRPKTRMKTSAIRNMRMFVRIRGAISGNDSLKISPSKNCSRTSGEPGAVTTSATSTPKKTIVLTAAIAVRETPCRRGSGSRGCPRP
jgi:hypothetical protein